MKNRIAQTKQFVVKHSHEFSAAAGLTVGVAATLYLKKSTPLPNYRLRVTGTQLKLLLENPGSYVTFDEVPNQAIELIIDHTE